MCPGLVDGGKRCDTSKKEEKWTCSIKKRDRYRTAPKTTGYTKVPLLISACSWSHFLLFPCAQFFPYST